MAVPKKKQSHSRTAKRRAQHKISAPGGERVPAVPQPAPAASRVPGVRHLRRSRGRRAGRARPRARSRRRLTTRSPAWRARPSSRSTATAPTSGRRRSRRAARSRRARRARAPVRAARASSASCRRESRSSTRRSRSRRPPTPSAMRSRPEASIVQAARAVAEGRAQALVCAGGTGAALAATMFNIKRARGIYRPALALPLPVPGAPGDAARRRRQRRGAPRAPRAVRVHGRGARADGARRARARASACSPTARRPGAAARSCSRRTPSCASARRRATDAFEFVGNVEGDDLVAGRGGRGRHRRLHRQHRAEADRGRLADDARARSATPPAPRARGKVGGLLLRGALRRLPRGDRPRGQRRRLPARPAPARRRAARPLHAPSASRRRSCAPQRGAREDIVGQTHDALAAAGALRRSPLSAADASLPRTG